MKIVIRNYRGRQVLVAFPNVRQYGHQALEILFGYIESQRAGLPVFFCRPAKVSNAALFSLEGDGIELLRPSALGRWWLSTSLALEQRYRHWRAREHLVSKFRDHLAQELRARAHDPRFDIRVRTRLKDRAGRLKHGRAPKVERVERPHYYRRRDLRERVAVTLSPAALERVRREAAALGIDEGRPIVTLHARESGYKAGMEMQDTKPQSGRDDSTRNARIETYFDTIDFLVGLGYQVVRIGDPSMVPLQRPGVIDLATSARRTPLLEVYSIFQSRFLIGSDSGPSAVVYLTNTPLVCVNTTDPIAAYPIRSDGLYLVKTVTERATGKRLRLREMLQAQYMASCRNSSLYEYHDNTPREILESVKEMLRMLDGGAPLTSVQEEYKRLVLAAEAQLRPVLSYVRKWGCDDGFLGDGRIGAFFAEQHL